MSEPASEPTPSWIVEPAPEPESSWISERAPDPEGAADERTSVLPPADGSPASDLWLPDEVAAARYELPAEPAPPVWAEAAQTAPDPAPTTAPPDPEPATPAPETEPASFPPDPEFPKPPVWATPPGADRGTEPPERTPSAPWLAIASEPVAEAHRSRSAKLPLLALAAVLLLAAAGAAAALALHHSAAKHSVAATSLTRSVPKPRPRPASTADRLGGRQSSARRPTAHHVRRAGTVGHTAPSPAAASHPSSPSSVAVAPRVSAPAPTAPATPAPGAASDQATRSTATPSPGPPTSSKAPSPASQPTGGVSVGSSP